MFTNINALQGTLCLQNMSKHVQSFSRVLCWSLHIFDASTYKYQFYTNPIQILYKSNPIQIEDLYWVRFVKSF